MPDIEMYTWDQIDAVCRQLANKIVERFDVIVCVLRGGAIPGVILANYLGIEEVCAIKVVQRGQVSGAGRGTGAYEAEAGAVLVPLNDLNLQGLRVLVVDDVLDSGESMRLVLHEVSARAPALVRLAVMQKKDYSGLEPDYYVETKHDWLFYPWMSEAELSVMRQKLEERKAQSAGAA